MPIFVTEFGVRGHDRPPAPGVFKPGGRLLSQTNVAAFQQAWFVIRSMQLGYHGTIKWDCSHGIYDSTYKHKHYVIGDRKSTLLNSRHCFKSRIPSSS